MTKKILVVDPDDTLRATLGSRLARNGHHVAQARTGGEAIDLGARFRPHVLVINSMLESPLHGLQVTRALHLVKENMRTILLTELISDELQEDADELGVYRLFEPPLGMDELQGAVEEAAAAQSDPNPGHPIAVLEVGKRGEILHRNGAARHLLDSSGPGPGPTRLEDLFGVDDLPDLDLASRRWVPARPLKNTPDRWFLRSYRPRPSATRIVALARGEEFEVGPRQDALGALLRIAPGTPLGWPHDGRVMILDHNPLHRRLFLSILEIDGIGCYAVDRVERALRLIDQDEEIKVFLLDFETAGERLPNLLARLDSCPGSKIVVGTSSSERRREFRDLGVTRFVKNPWCVKDLLRLIRSRKPLH